MASPSALRVHGALIVTQVIFGGGSVVGKLGVEVFNPMLFCLLRESLAGPVFLALAFMKDGSRAMPRCQDAPLFTLCGLCIFGNQSLFIIGDKLAGPVLGSAWQCTQPILTLIISAMLGWEELTLLKTLGIFVSFAGGAFMIFYGQSFQSSNAVGNCMFLLNCLGTSLYVIFAKILLQKYTSLTTVAWSYMLASVMTGVVAGSLNTQCWFIHFVCPPSSSQTYACGPYENSCQPWQVPRSAILPLAYWVLGSSLLAYMLMTWANQYAKAGFVLAYTALQPLTSTLLSILIIAVSGPDGTSLKMPGINALGGIPVIAGLAFILKDGQRQHAQPCSESLVTSEDSIQCSHGR